MKEVRISISLAATQPRSYNAYLSSKALAAKVKSLKADGMTYKVVCQYTGVLLASS